LFDEFHFRLSCAKLGFQRRLAALSLFLSSSRPRMQRPCFYDSHSSDEVRLRVETFTPHGACMTSCINSICLGGSTATSVKTLQLCITCCMRERVSRGSTGSTRSRGKVGRARRSGKSRVREGSGDELRTSASSLTVQARTNMQHAVDERLLCSKEHSTSNDERPPCLSTPRGHQQAL